MKKYNFIASLFFLGFGLFFTFYARTLEIGTVEEPGPGFLPFWAGILLAGMAVLLFLKTLIGKVIEADLFFPEKDSWKRVSMVFLSLIAYNLLLNTLGFTLVTFLFVGFLVKAIFPQGWITTVVTAALATLGARLLFVNLLELNFPKGLLGF
ncbi:MAG: tripartite tricarboxylate transporter TctB family protein [Syntrophales bacterium LBB04]|nr:tripartite tricarboxylate transporter TctB family protein [Syntrophales bacterium LBB04]